jgi:transcriptional accessory protein Tex/SPT6
LETPTINTGVSKIILTRESQDENNDDSISRIDRDATPKDDPSKDIDRTSTDGESNSDSDTYLEADTKLRKRSRGRRHISKKSKMDALDLVSTAGPESEKTITVSRTVNHEETTAPSEKQVDTRRCIGRKPVTDFVIGNTYKGKVVYVKPFGAFIDIGCHSDGFVHVSRVHDDFVEDINSVLKGKNLSHICHPLHAETPWYFLKLIFLSHFEFFN